MFDSLVLASGSPRRRDILGQLGVSFRVLPSEVDETPEPAWTPLEMATLLAAKKADDVTTRLAGENDLVLGADPIVMEQARCADIASVASLAQYFNRDASSIRQVAHRRRSKT
jgi:predicted house-cleaning NTP pyrophosphatase (Maf/HAM1 superfamily)